MDFMKTLVLIVALSGFLAHSTAIRTPQARVWAMCKNTSYPLLCYKTILPQVGPKFNLYKALEIEVKETQKQVFKTTAKFAGSILTKGLSEALSSPLDICKDQYSSIVEDVATTVMLLYKHDIGEAQFKFSAVISYNQACRDGFVDIASPLAEDTQAVTNLAANCLDLMKAIEDRDARRRAKKRVP